MASQVDSIERPTLRGGILNQVECRVDLIEEALGRDRASFKVEEQALLEVESRFWMDPPLADRHDGLRLAPALEGGSQTASDGFPRHELDLT